MRHTRFLAALCICLCVSTLYAQEEPGDKKGMYCVGVSMSDYTILNHSKYTSSSNTNFGLQLSFWKMLVPRVDVSTNFGINLSRFPAGLIKYDSLGHSDATMHAEILFHLKAFTREVRVNPFITAGIGGATFGYEPAAYIPVGAGAAFHFNGGNILILQGQVRKPVSSGITNSFMFYTAGFAHEISGTGTKKHKGHKNDAAKDALSSANSPGKAQNSLTDQDGDGVADKDDRCPTIKGSRENAGCPFPPVDGADIVSMSSDSVTYSIYFAYDQSELVGYDFSVLGAITQILKSDKTLTIHIGGYADTFGTQARNMQVSAERAKVTSDYFISYGIAASRITSDYYGSGHPLDTVMQWRNRRAEITIIKH